MKFMPVRVLGALLLSLVFASFRLSAADALPDAAGYWDGAITLPNAALEMRIEITRQGDRAWTATIDMPAQGAWLQAGSRHGGRRGGDTRHIGSAR